MYLILNLHCSCFFLFILILSPLFFFFFFFNDTATTEIYTLSLHDALPTSNTAVFSVINAVLLRSLPYPAKTNWCASSGDRKSTRLNSSHSQISYAVFCLKKKKNYGIVQQVELSDSTVVRESCACHYQCL